MLNNLPEVAPDRPSKSELVSTSYDTDHELAYLKTIGEYKRTSREGVETVYENLPDAKKAAYKQFPLMQYIRSMKLRVNWSKIDKHKISFVAHEMLDELSN